MWKKIIKSWFWGLRTRKGGQWCSDYMTGAFSQVRLPSWHRLLGLFPPLKGTLNPSIVGCLPGVQFPVTTDLHSELWFSLSFLLACNCFTMLLVFAVQGSGSVTVYIYTLPPESPSLSLPSHLLGDHRAPSWAPCTREQLPTSYLFHTW